MELRDFEAADSPQKAQEIAQRLDLMQRQNLFLALKSLLDPNHLKIQDLTDDVRERRFGAGFQCPHCESREVIRNGKVRGSQRYHCKQCLRTFGDYTRTPLSGTRHPDKWLAFMECMVNGLSLRKSAEIIGVTHVSLFYWRHKVLSALSRLDLDNFQGIMEVDETYFLHSRKGERNLDRKPRKRGGTSKFRGISREQVCVLAARDRSKRTQLRVACMGQMGQKRCREMLDDYVGDVITLCSDAAASYKLYTAEKGLEHVVLNAQKKERKRGIYHIQNINSCHSRLKGWIHSFNGVASKYLDNYLTWFRFVDANQTLAMSDKQMNLLLSACLTLSDETFESLRKSKFQLAT